MESRARRPPFRATNGSWPATSSRSTAGSSPGRTYELAYAAANPPVAGLGFVAVRDTASWLKHARRRARPGEIRLRVRIVAERPIPPQFPLRGLQHRRAATARCSTPSWRNIAGAARIDVNRRWATPTALGQFTATSFPFADSKQRDPVTGVEEGALDNPRARDHQPKIFYTNTGVEYWGGGRSAALIHTTPDGAKDLALPDNERVYFLAGSQHGPARFPSAVTNGQQKDNPNDYWLAMRGAAGGDGQMGARPGRAAAEPVSAAAGRHAGARG